MKQVKEYPAIDVEKTLAEMPAWVAEKERRYYLQKEIAEMAFGEVVEYIFGKKKKTAKKKSK